MARRILGVVVLSAVLTTATLMLASCGERDTESMATSPVLGAATTEGAELVEQLGNAAISYLGGTGDLAAVEALVTPSAQDDLAQMLSRLNHPTSREITTLGYYSGEEVEVQLVFRGDDESATFTVTLLVDPDALTITGITAIRPGGIADQPAPDRLTGLRVAVGVVLAVIALGALAYLAVKLRGRRKGANEQ
jgi:hypothetical protein